MRTLTKLVATSTVIALLGTSTVYYVSKNEDIQKRINKLYNIGNEKAVELDKKNAMLNDIATYLGLNDGDKTWDGKYESLISAIDGMADDEGRNTSSADMQELLNEIAGFLGLPARDGNLVTINYGRDQIIMEIDTLYQEVIALEQYIEEYANYNSTGYYKDMTLLQKLQSMINQITKANEESVAQLSLATQRIVDLGFCAKDTCEGTLNASKVCTTCGEDWSKATTNEGRNESTATTYYSITKDFTNVTTVNDTVKIAKGGSYTAILTPLDGYDISSIKVTMGGEDVTDTVVNGTTVSISQVTGNVVITAKGSANNQVSGTQIEKDVAKALKDNGVTASMVQSVKLTTAKGYKYTNYYTINIATKVSEESAKQIKANLTTALEGKYKYGNADVEGGQFYVVTSYQGNSQYNIELNVHKDNGEITLDTLTGLLK